MAGNLWELTSSTHCPYTTTGRQACTETAHVERGGCWAGSPSSTRSANRVWCDPSSRFDVVGFRCAR